MLNYIPGDTEVTRSNTAKLNQWKTFYLNKDGEQTEVWGYMNQKFEYILTDRENLSVYWICYIHKENKEQKKHTVKPTAKIYTGLFFSEQITDELSSKFQPIRDLSPIKLCIKLFGEERKPKLINSKEYVIAVSEAEYTPLMAEIEQHQDTTFAIDKCRKEGSRTIKEQIVSEKSVFKVFNIYILFSF